MCPANANGALRCATARPSLPPQPHTRVRSGISTEILRLFSGTHSRPFRANEKPRRAAQSGAERVTEVFVLFDSPPFVCCFRKRIDRLHQQ